jgi:hypothetical protein
MGALLTRDNDVLSRAAAAFGRRGSLLSFWQDVALNHYPERADFTAERSIGEDVTSTLYSSEPILFRREFGNFLGSILRPKGRKWFSMSPREQALKNSTAVKIFLEPMGDNIRSLLYTRKSGYTRAMTACDHDYATFGNAVGSVEEAPDLNGLRFRSWHLRDCAWEQNMDGEVDTMFRKFSPTVRDLCGRATKGWDVSAKVTELRAKEPDKRINCMHIEMPVIDYDYTIKRPRFDWVSLYYDVDNKQLLSFKLIPEFDYFVDRWFLLEGSPYAVSPCVICSLPDARSLQIMTWSIIEAGEKSVEPPLIGVHEAIMGGVNVTGGSVTWVDRNYDERTGEALRALELGGNPQFGEVLRQSITNNLNAAWFLNKLFMPQTYDKTAYEANRLHEEFLRAMHPIMEPAEAERNGNHLEVVFAKASRLKLLGSLKEMPRELQGRDVDFSYDNPMEDARKEESSFAYRSAMEINKLAMEQKPEVVSQFNHAKAYRDAIGGVSPPDWLLSEDEAEAAVETATEESDLDQGAQQIAAMAETQAKVAPKGQQVVPA